MSAVSGENDPLESRISNLDRERAIAALGTALQQGRLDAGEFSERCATAWSARTRGELLAVLADLPGANPPVLELQPLVLNVAFGQVRRVGRWPVPELVQISGIGQRTMLDFSEAEIRRPEVVVEVRASMSSTVLLLPSGAEVDSDGLELVAGAVRHPPAQRRERTGRLRGLLPGGREPERPPLPRFVLRGRATLASVTIRYRDPSRGR